MTKTFPRFFDWEQGLQKKVVPLAPPTCKPGHSILVQQIHVMLFLKKYPSSGYHAVALLGLLYYWLLLRAVQAQERLPIVASLTCSAEGQALCDESNQACGVLDDDTELCFACQLGYVRLNSTMPCLKTRQVLFLSMTPIVHTKSKKGFCRTLYPVLQFPLLIQSSFFRFRGTDPKEGKEGRAQRREESTMAARTRLDSGVTFNDVLRWHTKFFFLSSLHSGHTKFVFLSSLHTGHHEQSRRLSSQRRSAARH